MDHKNIFEIAFNAKNGKYGDEDLLTDLFAWYLCQDEDTAIRLVRLVTGISPSLITAVNTQPVFAGFPGDLPDMVITTPEVDVIFEHKIGAGLGSEQLERYLKVATSEECRSSKPCRLVFIARDLVAVPRAACQDSHYCRPAEAAHFRWKDVYRLVLDNLTSVQQQHELRVQLLNCMRYLKLAFLTPTGDFNLLFCEDPVLHEERVLQERAFGEAWKTIDGTVASFEMLKFKPDYGSRKELYLIAGEDSHVPSSSGLKHLHLSPTDGKRMPKEAPFQPPCLKYSVNFNRECADVIERITANTPSRLEAFELPVAVRPGKTASDPLQFWFPLGPLLECASLSNSLRTVVVEVYEKVIHPAFDNRI